MAHELRRRPVVAEALRAGRLSYSAARALTRMDRPDPAVDQAVVELEEFASALQAFVDRRWRPVEESPAEDRAEEAPLEQATPGEERARAVMDMVGVALAHADRRPLEAGRIACDCATVAHAVGTDGEPLALGRRSREWSSAQRRAIAVRDGGHCRFVGCRNRLYDIHTWEEGGPTDVDNGCAQCRRHHRMLHHGYRAEGDPSHEMRFYRPDGSYIGSTRPALQRQLLPLR